MTARGQLLLSLVLLAYSADGGAATSTCCQFELTSACAGWPTYGLGWYSSSTKSPNWSSTGRGAVTHSSDYLWTQNIGGAILTSIEYTSIGDASTFSFLYYADVTGSATLGVTFVTTEGVTYPLATLVDNKYTDFTTYVIDCAVTPCCAAGATCDGTLKFTAYFTAGESLFAIDNVESDGGCANPICCAVSSADICGWSNVSPALPWEWSGSAKPDMAYIPEFKPESDYGWLQVISGAVPANSILASPQVTGVNSNFNFTIRYYVDISPLNSENSLIVYFQEDGSSYSRVVLATLFYTSHIWQSVTLFCTGLAGQSCCAGGSTCTGHLELDPSNASGQLFYAIDNIEMNSQCFP